MLYDKIACPNKINRSISLPHFPLISKIILLQACPSPSPTWGLSLTSSSSPPWWCRTPTRTTPRRPSFPTRILSSLGTVQSHVDYTLGVKYGGRSPKFIWTPCHVMCTAVLIGWDPATPSLPPHWDSYTRALLVSKDRRHLFVTPLGLQHEWALFIWLGLTWHKVGRICDFVAVSSIL